MSTSVLGIFIYMCSHFMYHHNLNRHELIEKANLIQNLAEYFLLESLFWLHIMPVSFKD